MLCFHHPVAHVVFWPVSGTCVLTILWSMFSFDHSMERVVFWAFSGTCCVLAIQ